MDMKRRIHLELRNRTPSDVSWPRISLGLALRTRLMENLSCDVLAWTFKVSSKLKDDGAVGAHRCERRLRSAGAAGALLQLLCSSGIAFEASSLVIWHSVLCQRYKQGDRVRGAIFVTFDRQTQLFLV